jgi:hypothetical protein
LKLDGISCSKQKQKWEKFLRGTADKAFEIPKPFCFASTRINIGLEIVFSILVTSNNKICFCKKCFLMADRQVQSSFIFSLPPCHTKESPQDVTKLHGKARLF